MSPSHPLWTRGDGPGAFSPCLSKNSLWSGIGQGWLRAFGFYPRISLKFPWLLLLETQSLQLFKG